MTCFLYRHFNEAGELLYVGISLCAIARLEQHKRSPWFQEIRRVEIEQYPTREQAQFKEAWAIRREKPKYNKDIPAYSSSEAVNLMACIQGARSDIWKSAWDPNHDSSLDDDVLMLCAEAEARVIGELYRRQAEQRAKQ
jgi:hypothetical protein